MNAENLTCQLKNAKVVKKINEDKDERMEAKDKIGRDLLFFHEFSLDFLVLKARENSLQACFCGFLQVKMQLVRLHSKCDEKTLHPACSPQRGPPI